MAFRPNRTKGLTTEARLKLRSAVASWERKKSGRIVTSQAYEIIIQSISAISDDPSHQWSIKDHGDLRNAQNNIISSIPNILSELESYAGTSRIDTFTLLHSISGLLDSICPFDKPSKSQLQQLE